MTALLDTNVFVAAVVVDHPHRNEALALLERGGGYATGAHVVAEMFNTLTKPRGYGWPPSRAWAVIRPVTEQMPVFQLSAETQIAAIGQFARTGGVGARLYDWLIGQVAIEHDLDPVVTLNISHFTPLFPQLIILTPAQYLETL